ncbi:MAG: cupin domain-containing protein [Pseudomonadota bacterium]|nr:cupin domain-containing protein [Pseudomonadota bacterium]
MSGIQYERNPSPAKLEVMGVYDWPVWEKGASTFDWRYDTRETCYFVEGEVSVTPVGEAPVRLVAGDLVTFPEGMQCTWQILQPVVKHYSLG